MRHCENVSCPHLLTYLLRQKKLKKQRCAILSCTEILFIDSWKISWFFLLIWYKCFCTLSQFDPSFCTGEFLPVVSVLSLFNLSTHVSCSGKKKLLKWAFLTESLSSLLMFVNLLMLKFWVGLNRFLKSKSGWRKASPGIIPRWVTLRPRPCPHVFLVHLKKKKSQTQDGIFK